MTWHILTDRWRKTFWATVKREIPAAERKSAEWWPGCNVGQVEQQKDYSNLITDKMKVMSEKIAKAAQLPVIGIDFMGDQVIEFNACPMLYYPPSMQL